MRLPADEVTVACAIAGAPIRIATSSAIAE